MQVAKMTFVRDRFTWLAYFMLGYYAYLQASLGPISSPFLQNALNLNYTVTAFHISGFALGMLLSGLCADIAARELGRARVFWGGALGMSVGAALVAIAPHPIVSVGGSFVMGFLGTFLLIMIQATLSDHHGELRATALTEANVVAMMLAALPPSIIGYSEQYFIGWRMALYTAMAMLILFRLSFSGTQVPETQTRSKTKTDQSTDEKLPPVYWIFWVVVFMSVALEWSLISWGAAFLIERFSLSDEVAAQMMSIFFIAMVLGRVTGSRLTARFSTVQILGAALLLVLISFPIFWQARILLWSMVGFCVVGIGIGNLFPLALSAATNSAPTIADRASARVSFAAGTAIFTVPQMLGIVADRVGIINAYGIVPVIVLLAGIAVFSAQRIHKTEQT